MAIGLYDCDAISLPKKFKINLEVMKLASYYKSKNQIVINMLNPETSTIYDKIFLRKDLSKSVLPEDLMTQDNVEYGGLSFSGDSYISLPEDIELANPDQLIYENYLSNLVVSKHHMSTIKSELRSTLIRLSTNGIDCNHTTYHFRNNSKRIIIFDRDIASLTHSFEILSDFRKTHRITSRFPIVFRTKEEIEQWYQNPILNKNSSCLVTVQLSSDEYEHYADLLNKGAYYGQIEFGNQRFENQRDYLHELKSVLTRIISNKIAERYLVFTCPKDIVPFEWQDAYNLLDEYSKQRANSYSLEQYCTITYRPPRFKKFIEKFKDEDAYMLCHSSPSDLRRGGIKWKVL